MPAYTTADIRNVVLVGHGGSGKTSLAEAMLHTTGATGRLGSVADKTSHLDVDDEERERGFSVEPHILHVTHDHKQINIIDTPGATDLVGPAIAALAAAETAVLVVNAGAGIQVNTRKFFEHAKNYGLARVVVVNRIDADPGALEELLKSLREAFGESLAPFNLPANKGKTTIACYDAHGHQGTGTPDFGDVGACYTQIIERVIETDEKLMNEYFEKGEVPPNEIIDRISDAIAAGILVPVLFTNAKGEVGVRELLDCLADDCPSPTHGKQRSITRGTEEIALPPKIEAPFTGLVFKVHYEAKSNIKYAFIRIFSGHIKGDGNLHPAGDKRGMRIGHLLKFQGAAHVEIDEAIAGDIVAIAKLDLHIGTTVYSVPAEGNVKMPRIPTPMFSLAVEPKARGDEGKIADALRRLHDIDPCFRSRQDPQTHELVISGVGDLHLRIMLSKMHRSNKIDVNTKPPKIPYRETISSKADGHYRHKKQSGGAGQFGEVFLTVSPLQRGAEPPLEWAWDIFGGSIPGQFESAIKKGCTELMEQGALAGFPLQDVKVSITDGKHHPVDSKEVAFKIAGKFAFRDAILKAHPVLLEPIVNIEVTVPTENVGDVTGDIASRRGRPQGQDMLPGNMAVIKAQAPLAKMADYHSRLSSISGGKGSFAMELSHYEPVPSHEAGAIIAQYKPHKGEDEE